MAHPHEGVLSYFWALADLDESRRVTAAQELIAHLAKLQEVPLITYRAHTHALRLSEMLSLIRTSDTRSSVSSSAVPPPSAATWTHRSPYRGLASPRAGARQGFALALTAVCFPRFSLPDLTFASSSWCSSRVYPPIRLWSLYCNTLIRRVLPLARFSLVSHFPIADLLR